MNKIYDKLLLIIATFFVFVSLWVYVKELSAVSTRDQSLGAEIVNHPYLDVPILKSRPAEVSWPDAPRQVGSGWVYDVFTPPRIYSLPDGTFTVEYPNAPVEEVPFGVYLSEIKRMPYRIQIEGYVEEDLSASSKYLVLLYDEENYQSIRVRIGDVSSVAEFELVDFEIKRISDSQKGVYQAATAKLFDRRSNEVVTLRQGERLYLDDVHVVIRSEEDATVEIELMQVGEAFETALGCYVLKEICFEESAVILEKRMGGSGEPEVKLLTVQSLESVSINTKSAAGVFSEIRTLESEF